MKNTKEFNEILLIFKELIMNNEIEITEDSFSISSIKAILQSHPKFQPEIQALKEKTKTKVAYDLNILAIASLVQKKKTKDLMVLLKSLDVDTSLFYNEPFYIREFNKALYNRFKLDLKMGENQKLISFVTIDFVYEILNMKEEAYDTEQFTRITSDFILKEVYSLINSNYNFKTGAKFRFNLNDITIQFLNSTYSSLIMSHLNTNEEQINAKRRRDNIKRLINENKNIQLVDYLKGGVPNELRKNIYISLLGIDKMDKSNINLPQNMMLIDYYLIKEAKVIAEGENYFLFEEDLIKLLTTIFRDSTIIKKIRGIRPIFLIEVEEKNGNFSLSSSILNDVKEYVPYPQSGLFPIQGIGYQLAPFTYFSKNLDDYYVIARDFFTNYLSYLTSFTTNKNSILTLICSFNTIFTECNAMEELNKFFILKKFDVIKIVFNWFITSFGTVLAPESVFHLYDLVIMTKSLSIYVLMALSLLYYKREDILSCAYDKEIETCISEICYDLLDPFEIMNTFLLKAS